MTDPTSRQAVAELYAGVGWPVDGDELLRRSLGPRSPEMLLEAPAGSGSAPGRSCWTPAAGPAAAWSR